MVQMREELLPAVWKPRHPLLAAGSHLLFRPLLPLLESEGLATYSSISQSVAGGAHLLHGLAQGFPFPSPSSLLGETGLVIPAQPASHRVL